MAETKMPAAEAALGAHDDEHTSYELAFHVLPTVAEGEVAGVFEKLKAHITKAGGELIGEEAPERIDLAYAIARPVEGKNRTFHSAYFGWIRFVLEAAKLPELHEDIEHMPEILRTLMVKLTKHEEAHPFRYHEAMREKEKKVRTVEEREVRSGGAGEDPTAEVSDEALDKSLDRITDDADVAEKKEDTKEEA